jgi:hypothetical protein
MAIPFSSPDAAYSIAHGDVVDLKAKTRPRESAPQHLRDCLRGAERAGQFLSAGRHANESVRQRTALIE